MQILFVIIQSLECCVSFFLFLFHSQENLGDEINSFDFSKYFILFHNPKSAFQYITHNLSISNILLNNKLRATMNELVDKLLAFIEMTLVIKNYADWDCPYLIDDPL